MPIGSFYIETLGCPKNQVDSEKIKYQLLRGGLKQTNTAEEADYILVNTCTFIKEAKEQTIEQVLRLAQKKKKHQKLIMLGCMVERYGSILKKELPEVDSFYGLNEIDSLIQTLGLKTITDKFYDYKPDTFPYAYLKIAEGCQRRCSFCIIPSVRGPLRSIPMQDIIKRAHYLIENGYKELILVAQDITSYGKDLNKGYGLKELLKELANIKNHFWIRLLYLYPTEVDESLLEIMANEAKICPYLDIPLQHSERRILKLMGRAGNKSLYKAIIKKARDVIRNLHLRTTFIIGFPTESHKDFKNLLTFIEEMEFDHLGAFIYSDEEGTKAYKLRPKVSEKIKKQRYENVMQLQAQISKHKLQRWIGKKLLVLVDSVEQNIAIARHPGQAPEIDGVVIIQNPHKLSPGQFVNVIIEDTTTYDLIGRQI